MAQRRHLLLALLLIGWPAVAHANLPTSIENVLRGYFASSGRCQLITCDGFDVPADTTNGGCVTLKEGSNNGTSIAKMCSPANLGASRTNTFNSDGTFKSSDIETPSSTDYGKSLRFNTTGGIIEGVPSPAYDFLPGTVAVPASVKTAVLTANLMRCATFVKRGTILNATKYAMNVIDAGGTASVCLYADSDAAGTLLFPLTAGAPATAIDTSGTGSKSSGAIDAFSLFDGVAYRLCWTSANTTVTLAAAGTTDANVENAFSVVRSGNATQAGTTGVCPTFTGALGTGASLAVPNVQVAQ